MSLLRFDPIRSFEQMSKKMSNVASEFEKGFSFEFGGFSPRIDITEDEKGTYFYVEIPGMKKEDIKVSVNEENIITIKGDKKVYDNKEELSFVRVERNFGEFTRSFMLPENVERDSIKAKFEDGVLSITLSKKEPEQPKEVEINID